MKTDKFIEAIYNSITTPGVFLSIVGNKDGFLRRRDTLGQLRKETSLRIVCGSQIELRIDYETVYKGRDKNDTTHYCYIVDDVDSILPDMKEEAFVCNFRFANLLSEYDAAQIASIENPVFKVIAQLYERKPTHDLSSVETINMLHEVWNKCGFDSFLENDKLREHQPDWQSAKSIKMFSEIYSDAISKEEEDSLTDQINRFNTDFQKACINGNYNSMQTRNEHNRPKIVSKILPYLNYAHSYDEKVALIVVDCMSYWQYLLLHDEMQKLGMEIEDDVVYSWLPSLTNLSRQAIFRGDVPVYKYAQSPASEEKLWNEFWKKNQMALLDYQIAYKYGGVISVKEDVLRFAYVDIALDDAAHGDTLLKSLYDETIHWAYGKASEIKTISDLGYHIYITSDHGNIMCEGWQNIKKRSKDVLLQDGEVSQRCLKFKNAPMRIKQYIDDNPEIKDEIWHRQNLRDEDYIMMSGNKCFNKDSMITHGGTHFLEVVVPFAYIKPKI